MPKQTDHGFSADELDAKRNLDRPGNPFEMDGIAASSRN